MFEDLKKLYIRFNYNEAKGFILNAPTLKEGEHISIAFDNNNREFNIHFTDDKINEPRATRRNFIFTISAFRFFLFLKRFEIFYKQNIVNLILSSKTNLGKLKRNKLIINTFLASADAEDKIIHKRKNGKHWKFREDFDFNSIAENFKYIDKTDMSKDSFHFAYKWKNDTLSLQGIIYKFEHLNGLYFIPIKKYNRFMKYMTISTYNYFNTYPSANTLPFRQLLYERLKHPYLDKKDEKGK